MKQAVLFLLFTTPIFLLANKSPHFDCPPITIVTDDGVLEIKNLMAPIEIMKVFDKNYEIIYQCNGDCPEEIILDNLDNGIYHIDIQSYTSDWQFICDKKKTVIVNNDLGTPSCADIKVEVNANTLTLSRLTSPNKIIKVFDVFYNILYQCSYNCGETIIIPNFVSGDYHIDIQLYTIDWQYICFKQQDITIDQDTEPCDENICLGNIILETQVQLDNFCGCKTIKGNLKIGKSIGSNITSLANLRKLERVEGDLTIVKTKIRDFDGLGNLGLVKKTVLISDNTQVEDFDGLGNLVKIGTTLSIEKNPKIKNLEGLNRLTDVKKVNFKENDNLEQLDKLSQMMELKYLEVVANKKLKTLPQLEQVDSLLRLTISNNTALENIDFLRPISYLEGAVVITKNPSLSNCCGLIHLIDEDDFYGSNNAIFNINNNLIGCNSTAEILQACQDNDPSCTDLQINATQNKITINGLTASNEIVKVFDENYAILYECFGNCTEPIQVDNLPVGTYPISINFYDENWNPICEINSTVILGVGASEVILNSRASEKIASFEEKFTLSPNPALAYTSLDLSELEGEAVQLELINTFGRKVWGQIIPKVITSRSRIDVSDLDNGLYFLRIRLENKRVRIKKLMVGRLY